MDAYAAYGYWIAAGAVPGVPRISCRRVLGQTVGGAWLSTIPICPMRASPQANVRRVVAVYLQLR
jgi:hypothetical protein